MNIYLDSLQSALKYLKNTEIDIPNILIMSGNFNIRDSFQNPLYLHHSIYSNLLIDIIDSLSLELSYPTNPIPIRYSDSNQSSNLVIDLIFLRYSLEELDNHFIHSEWRLLLNHASLTISISIKEQHIHNRKYSIAKSSIEENMFIKDIIKNFTTIDISNIMDIKLLEITVNLFALAINRTWEKNSKIVIIARHLKSW